MWQIETEKLLAQLVETEMTRRSVCFFPYLVPLLGLLGLLLSTLEDWSF
jgi:hypothetical protein